MERDVCKNCVQGQKCPYRHRDKCPDVQTFDEGYEQAIRDAKQWIATYAISVINIEAFEQSMLHNIE